MFSIRGWNAPLPLLGTASLPARLGDNFLLREPRSWRKSEVAARSGTPSPHRARVGTAAAWGRRCSAPLAAPGSPWHVPQGARSPTRCGAGTCLLPAVSCSSPFPSASMPGLCCSVRSSSFLPCSAQLWDQEQTDLILPRRGPEVKSQLQHQLPLWP